MNKIIKIDVDAINPSTGKIWTMKESRYGEIEVVNGEKFFRFNARNLWKVVAIREIPQGVLDAENAYFEKYGTACE